MSKIIGVTVGTTAPRPNWTEENERSAAYIKNKPIIDPTLTTEGAIADAKATGDAINKVQTSIDDIADRIGDAADGHIHDDRYYTETEIDGRLDTMQINIDSKVDAVDGMGLSTNDYTDAEKDKLYSIEANANLYEHPVHTPYSSGIYKIIVDDSGHVSGATLVEAPDIIALGIPAQDTVYDDSELSSRVTVAESEIVTINRTIDDISKGFEDYKEVNSGIIADHDTEIETNKKAIEGIQDDYLTSSDKTQLQDDIKEVTDQATTNKSAIEILNGEGEGSVKQSIDNAFNEFAANVTNDDVVNTYKELIDYAATHGPEFAQLVGVVGDIEIDVGKIEEDFESYKTAVFDQFEEVGTTIDGYVNDIYDGLGAKADFEHGHDIVEINGLEGTLGDLHDYIDDHIEKKDNPHEVNAEQVGAYTKEEVDTKIGLLKILVDTDYDGTLFFTNMLEDASEVRV